MIKIILIILAFTFAGSASAQIFEGKVVYKNIYKSKIKNVTDEQLMSMMGSTQEYFIKNGNYISVSNGTHFQWQLYVPKENRVYTKVSDSETPLWNDAAQNTKEIIKTEVNKSVAEVLGYKVDEVVLTCKNGVEKYYFSSTMLPVDPKHFVNHKFGNWYHLVSITRALPLKWVVDNAQFTLESVAIEVKETKMEDKLFALPPNVKPMKGATD